MYGKRWERYIEGDSLSKGLMKDGHEKSVRGDRMPDRDDRGQEDGGKWRGRLAWEGGGGGQRLRKFLNRK